jgi:DNA polymerase
MQSFTITDFNRWRETARLLIANEIAPADVKLVEDDGQRSFFSNKSDLPNVAKDKTSSFRVPCEFITLAQTVGYHRDPNRWNLLYRTLWRLKNQQPHLLEIETDDDVHRLTRMEKQVRRDAHKMKAFVRFRKVIRDGEEFFIAWHQPDHRIVRRVAPFFSRRFAGMNWTILTPDESVTWDQQSLQYGKGVTRSEAPDFDELEELWRTYYANIFNPARVKVKMMKSEMPVRYWKNLPEAEIISDLLADAPRRVEQMIEQHEGFDLTAIDFIKPSNNQPITLASLQQMAASCTACDLHDSATQTVFGVGPANAKIVLLGEQPGDQEDVSGEPFVGPAGKVLDEALQAAGLDRSQLYLSNVVKHFKHTFSHENQSQPSAASRGKKRLHQKPNAREVRCCRPWFDAEWSCLEDARVLVCLGATAAKAILGPSLKLTDIRGRILESDYCERTIATWHPSAILRSHEIGAGQKKMRELERDLKLAAPSAHESA